METLILEACPAPTKRAIKGQTERAALSYQLRNVIYDCDEALIRCWKRHQQKLPPKTQAILGVENVAQAVRILKPHIRKMMKCLGVKTVKELLFRYGKCGGSAWSFDHIEPLRFAKTNDVSDLKKFGNLRNVRLKIALRNKARKWEPPADHDELFREKEAV